MTPQTLALRITEATYSIAVACLPPGFAVIPFKTVQGDYLVINKLSNRQINGERLLTVENTYYTPEDFHNAYDIVEHPEKEHIFAPVISK